MHNPAMCPATCLISSFTITLAISPDKWHDAERVCTVQAVAACCKAVEMCRCKCGSLPAHGQPEGLHLTRPSKTCTTPVRYSVAMHLYTSGKRVKFFQPYSHIWCSESHAQVNHVRSLLVIHQQSSVELTHASECLLASHFGKNVMHCHSWYLCSEQMHSCSAVTRHRRHCCAAAGSVQLTDAAASTSKPTSAAGHPSASCRPQLC